MAAAAERSSCQSAFSATSSAALGLNYVGGVGDVFAELGVAAGSCSAALGNGGASVGSMTGWERLDAGASAGSRSDVLARIPAM